MHAESWSLFKKISDGDMKTVFGTSCPLRSLICVSHRSWKPKGRAYNRKKKPERSWRSRRKKRL